VVYGIFVASTLYLLYRLNLRGGGVQAKVIVKETVIINAALLGFLGSLLYFSRKVYVYLITDKFHRVMHEQGLAQPVGGEDVQRFRNALIGYYVYLSLRPMAGFVIGPLLLMALYAGLTTLSVPATGAEVAISSAGAYLVYFVSFVGGYSSSIMFDTMSELGRKLLRREFK
jgi:hypothetical protein